MNKSNLLTRRRAFELLGAGALHIPFSQQFLKPAGLTSEEGFSLIEKWKGETLSVEEVKGIFLATWPTIHRNDYDVAKLPCRRKLATFFDHQHMIHLIKLLKHCGGSDLLYVAINLPLQRTVPKGGMIAAMMWWSHSVWMKRSILRCFDPEITDYQIMKNLFSLSRLLEDANL